MALWNYSPKLDVWSGVAIGAGLVLAPVVLPMVTVGLRPILKGAVKGMFILYKGGRQVVSGTMQGAEDLIDEARSEASTELAQMDP